MRKKILTITLALMIILSVSTVVTNVKANIKNTEIESTQFIETSDDNQESNFVKQLNGNIENNAEEKIQTPNLGNAQYTITEAPVIIEEQPMEEKESSRLIDPDKPMIAITYDDGPSKYTSEILNVLKENNSAATFFVLGSRVNANKDVLNQMLEEGNQIGNHSYNHKNLTTINDEELYKQIQGTDDLVYMATGYTPSVMRPPYGSTNEDLNKKILKPIIQWSIDTRDWENRNTEIIINTILENVSDGDIILMHDLYDSTAQASKIVIPELINRGYQLVTIEELFEYKDVTFTAGQQYYKMYKQQDV